MTGAPIEQRSPGSRVGPRARPDTAAATNTMAWRRISLERQLPRPRPPAGIAVPAATCGVALLLLAALCVPLFGQLGGRRVAQAVVDSQQQLVATMAREVNASANRSVDVLTDAADRYAEDPGRDAKKLLDALNDGGSRWRGTAVVDGSTRQLIAAQGEPVPVERMPPDVSRVTSIPLMNDGDARLLMAVPLTDGRLLVGAAVVRVRELRLSPDSRQTVLLATTSQEMTHVQGIKLTADDQVVALVRQAVADTAHTRVTSVTGPASGSSLDGATAPVVSASAIGSLDLSVVSLVHAPVIDGGSRWQGMLPAVGLLVVAGLALLLVRRGLIRPVRELLRYAKAVASGGPNPPSRLPGTDEARRIMNALNRVHGRLTGLPGKRRKHRRGASATMAALAAAMTIVGWSVGVMWAFGEGASELPQQVVDDTQNQVNATAGTVSESLDGGLTQLVLTAARHRSADPGRLRGVVERLAEREKRFSGVYVVDGAGNFVVGAGREPLRAAGRLPGASGIRLAGVAGRVPVIYAYTTLSDRHFLVAEFDIQYLTSLLRRVDGRVRVVDPDLRTILDTGGYLAFQRLSADALRHAASAGLAGRPSAEVITVDGSPALVVGAGMGVHRTTAHLEWSVVVERSVHSFRLGVNERMRRAWLVAILGTCIALTLFGWHYFLHLRPLRKLAQVAERLAAGDTSAVLYPHRPDEVGALAVCLEICRQVEVNGEERLAGAVRLRGADGAQTVVMSCIVAAPRTEQSLARRH